MRIYITIIFLLITILTNAQKTFPIDGVEETFKPVYALTNATIFTSHNTVIKNGVLLIYDNIIIDVDSNLEIPQGAVIYDLKGDYIYPGFIDLFSDYGIAKSEIKKNTSPENKDAYHWNYAIHPEFSAAKEFESNSENAKNYLNIGFTSVLTHHQDGIFRGTGSLVNLTNKLGNENIILNQVATFYSFNKGSSNQRYPTSRMGSIALIRQTLLDAEWYNNNNRKTNVAFDAFNKNKSLPKIFDVKTVLNYSRLYNISDEFEIDFIAKGSGEEFLSINEIKETKFPLIVPINFPKTYDVTNPDDAQEISLSNLKKWETAPYNLKILNDNNINFCITASDLSEKKDFIKNIRLAVKKGLPQEIALKSLTSNPAKLIGVENIIGSLEKNKLANFIVCSSNIFEDGIIYESWSSGERHIVNEKIKKDIRGYYTLNSDEYKDYLVQITGSKSKPKVKINQIDSSGFITKIDQNKIIISNTNKFRSSSKIYENSIIGKYQDENGDYHNFVMNFDSNFVNKKEKFSQNIDTIIPSIWSPNKSYGLIEKPIEEKIVFRNATIWTNSTLGIIENSDVAIYKGKILAVGKSLRIKDVFKSDTTGIKIIDAKEKHIASGIIDEHSHIAISAGVNESSQAVTAEVSIADVINPFDHNIYRQLAGGVTSSQLLHGSANPIGGQSALIKLRWGATAEEMKIKDSDGFIKFALGENVKQSNWRGTRFPQTRMGVEQVFYDAFYRAKNYKKEWNKFNNLSSRKKRVTTPPREDLELNILSEILDNKRFITCHSYVESEINMLMHVADSMGFQVNTFTHILEGYKVADKLYEHGAGGSTFSDWWAYKFEVNDAIPYNATLLNNAKVVTAINSDDAEMGRRLNQEAAKAVKYGGSSEEDAWKMVTLNPAKLLHLDDRMGSIEVGKDADIVVWSDNPLSIYAKAEKTFIDGRCYFDIDSKNEIELRDKRERNRIVSKLSKSKDKNKIKVKRKEKEKHYHCDTLDHE